MAGDGRKRLFTLSGVVPVAAFLVEHLFVTASALGGAARLDAVLGALARSTIATACEIVFVFIPLGYHALYGLHLTVKPHDPGHTYANDGLYKLQKISGVVALAFIVVHLWGLRLQRVFSGLAPNALYTRLTDLLSATTWGVPWLALFVLLGVAASVFHLMNGLWAYRAATARPDAATSRAFIAFGTLLFVVGATTIVSVATGAHPLSPAEPAAAPCGPEAASASPAPSSSPSTQTAP